MVFTEEKDAGQALKTIIQSQSSFKETPSIIGKYKGLDIFIRKTVFEEKYIGLRGESDFEVPLKISDKGNIQQLVKIVDGYSGEIDFFPLLLFHYSICFSITLVD